MGRPLKFSEPTVPMTVRVPQSRYDELCREARRSRQDVATYVRERIGIQDSYSFLDKRATRP